MEEGRLEKAESRGKSATVTLSISCIVLLCRLFGNERGRIIIVSGWNTCHRSTRRHGCITNGQFPGNLRDNSRSKCGMSEMMVFARRVSEGEWVIGAMIQMMQG